MVAIMLIQDDALFHENRFQESAFQAMLRGQKK